MSESQARPDHRDFWRGSPAAAAAIASEAHTAAPAVSPGRCRLEHEDVSRVQFG
jgi:hypothetical protein